MPNASIQSMNHGFWKPDFEKLTGFLKEKALSKKQLYSALGMKRSGWDRIVRQEAAFTTSHFEQIQILIEHKTEEWCERVAQPIFEPRRVNRGPIRGTAQELAKHLLEAAKSDGPSTTMYAAVTDGKWLSEFVASLPRAKPKGDKRLIVSRVDRIVVWLIDPATADCLLKRGIVDAKSIGRAEEHVAEIRTYRRLVKNSDGTARIVPLGVEVRYWPRLPPLWAAMVGDTMIAGEWIIDDSGRVADDPVGAMLMRHGSACRQFLDNENMLMQPNLRKQKRTPTLGAPHNGKIKTIKEAADRTINSNEAIREPGVRS